MVDIMSPTDILRQRTDLLRQREEALTKALLCVVKTPHIVAYLRKYDPKALEQAFNALGLCRECGQGVPDERGYEHKSYCSLWITDEEYDG